MRVEKKEARQRRARSPTTITSQRDRGSVTRPLGASAIPHPFSATLDSMPRRGARQNGRVTGDSQPLLASSREDLSTTTDGDVLFAIEDDDGEHELETSALEDPNAHPSPRRIKADQSVRFQEQVQFIVPPLRSTLESRETGMYGMME